MGKGKTKPGFIRPMLCKAVAELPRGNEWICEVKWGGRRSIVVKDGSQVRVFAENGHRLDYPGIEETVREAFPESAAIDGEIIECEPSCSLKRCGACRCRAWLRNEEVHCMSQANAAAHGQIRP